MRNQESIWRRDIRTQRALLGGMLLLGLTAGCTPGSGGPAGGTPGGKHFSLFTPAEPEPSPPDPASVWPPRAVWASRFEFHDSPAQIAALMENAQQAGLNTVLFQVRGNGTVYYRSAIEPLAYASDPGFDPLAVACREAHRRGLALHAWVNVMPGWRGTAPPSDPRQLYNAHPEWFWYDQHGRRQPLEGFYVSLNPCLPEVRDYLVRVLREIVHNYPVDGLHLDYIRFPNEESPRGSDYPRDRRTLELYRRATGKRPQDGQWSWDHWRRGQVTELVREIREMTRRAGRTVRLSASCGVDIERWRKQHFQDGPAWLKARLVDLVFVMNYEKDTSAFARRQRAWFDAAPGCWTAPGIGLHTHPSASVTIAQLQLARRWGHGFSLFSAGELFSSQGRQRLEAIRPTLLSMREQLASAEIHQDGLAMSR